jgi:recombinational DNA repair ATPase RecF
VNKQALIYDEILDMARAVHGRAGVRKKSFGLASMELKQLYSLRIRSQRDGDVDKALNTAMEIVRREIDSLGKLSTAKSHAKVVLALVSLLRQAAYNTSASFSAKAMCVDVATGIVSSPKWLQDYLKNAPVNAREAHVRAITGVGVDEWSKFVKRLTEVNLLKAQPASVMAEGVREVIDLDVASRLSRLAETIPIPPTTLPIYDTTDAGIHIRTVTVSGFRGAVGAVTLDLTKGNRPADVLLWGDNGVGKSTIVDGIEFALQGRVDRSADFNSSLRASVRNLTAPKAEASVELSDDSCVQRTLIRNAAGRSEPSSLDVRPGFRLAPLVIRRADILRFLDTNGLARGTIFFDYFPDLAGSLGIRPDEELRQLEEERFLLRVARDDFAAQLATTYPTARVEFSNSAQLETFVSSELTRRGAQSSAEFESVFPEATQILIGQLRTIQNRASVIKRKLDRGVETLNPVAYEGQLARILPILQTVTKDLTASFIGITRATHVKAIRVLVAKSGPVSLDVVVEFDNGMSALPQQAFSEGYKDLIALLFFLVVTKKAAEHGQAKVLVLDDALQSVDSSIRVGVMAHILTEFKDWQLLVTGHDRAWQAQLRTLFAARGRTVIETSITHWSFNSGVTLGAAGHTRASSLQGAIDRADETMTASGAGLLLEQISQQLSWRLGISVTRREGDRYTLGDLWPGLAKKLRGTQAKQIVEAISLRLDIRNLLGAHYNEWADAIPWSDVRQLGEDCIALFNTVYCSKCASWMEKTDSTYSCRCAWTQL